MILLALLLLISDRARRPRQLASDPVAPREHADRSPLRARPAAVRRARLLHLEVGGVRRRRASRTETQNRRPLIEEQQIAARLDHHLRRRADRRVAPRGRRPPPDLRPRLPRGRSVGVRQPGRLQLRRRRQNGIERSENDLLAGEKNEFASIIDELQNQEHEGADITLTLDAQAQRLAVQLLQQAIASTPGSNGAGSVVAIEPATGAVKVMASIPGFDPNARADRRRVQAARTRTSRRRCSTGRPRAPTSRDRR